MAGGRAGARYDLRQGRRVCPFAMTWWVVEGLAAMGKQRLIECYWPLIRIISIGRESVDLGQEAGQSWYLDSQGKIRELCSISGPSSHGGPGSVGYELRQASSLRWVG